MMNRVVRLRNLLLFVAAAAVVLAVPISERLMFDQSLESFFADDDPDIAVLHRSRREFGGDEFVIVAWTEEQLLQHQLVEPPDLTTLIADRKFQPQLTDVAEQRISDLTSDLNQVPGVDSAQTQNLVQMLAKAPRIRSARRAMLQMFAGTLIGEDARTTAVILTLIPESEASVPRGDTLRQIRQTVRQFESDSAVAGEPVQIHDMFRLVEEDSRVLFLASLGVLAAVVLILFRGLRWVVGSVGLVLGVVVCTRAILVLAGSELSMVGSMLNSLVTVIGIATCMHVIVHYRDLRSQLEDDAGPEGIRRTAEQTLEHMAAPVFWTCFTTAVGFASLLVSRITPIRSFSVMMTLATAVVIVGCLMILPAMLASGRKLKAPGFAPFEDRLSRGLQWGAAFLDRHPRKTGLFFLALSLLCLPGILWLDVETNFSRNFRESSSIVRALRFVESRLGGVGTWEVAFDTPAELGRDFLQDITDLTDELRATEQDSTRLRIVSLADVANMPPRVRGRQWMLSRMNKLFPQLVAGLYNADEHRMRIVLRSLEQQPAEDRSDQIHRVRQVVSDFASDKTSLDGPQFQQATASGMFVLLTEILQSLLQDQLKSFLCACGGILLCMTVAFRSLRIGLISLLPNIFPVAFLLGVLGWIDVPMNIGTAMIASVSMGITVDSTIHYVFAFERARAAGASTTESLQTAHAGAGRALVFAHLALVAGFAVLTLSRFIPLAWFGALMSLSMLCALFGGLVLLPLLLRWTTPESSAGQTTG